MHVLHPVVLSTFKKSKGSLEKLSKLSSDSQKTAKPGCTYSPLGLQCACSKLLQDSLNWEQKTSNSESNLEKEEWNWRNQHAWFQALLQSHSYQDTMVLAQRQKYRSMEQNRKPRDKSMYLWTPYLPQRRQGYIKEKRQPL